MQQLSLVPDAWSRYLLSGVLAVCAAAACAAASATVISGSPPTSVTVGSTYSFRPATKDSAGYPILWFGINHKPAWATFNTKTGLLTGKPTSAQVGTYGDISIIGSDGREWASTSTFSITVKASGSGKGAPVIAGVPATSVTAGGTYRFQPADKDSAGYRILWFGIDHKPGWATFNTKTGLLTGKPTAAQVGTYSDIKITGSDGREWAATSTFSITVKSGTGSNTGTATLTWTAPTENTNGTAVTDLAGYHLHYGTSASNLSASVQIPSAAVRSYTFKDLAPAKYYFAIAAYTKTGLQSALSRVVSKTVE